MIRLNSNTSRLTLSGQMFSPFCKVRALQRSVENAQGQLHFHYANQHRQSELVCLLFILSHSIFVTISIRCCRSCLEASDSKCTLAFQTPDSWKRSLTIEHSFDLLLSAPPLAWKLSGLCCHLADVCTTSLHHIPKAHTISYCRGFARSSSRPDTTSALPSYSRPYLRSSIGIASLSNKGVVMPFVK